MSYKSLLSNTIKLFQLDKLLIIFCTVQINILWKMYMPIFLHLILSGKYNIIIIVAQKCWLRACKSLVWVSTYLKYKIRMILTFICWMKAVLYKLRRAITHFVDQWRTMFFCKVFLWREAKIHSWLFDSWLINIAISKYIIKNTSH